VSDVALSRVQLERDGGHRSIKERPVSRHGERSFDPNNIEYLEKGLEWNDFKRLQ
jgi:hypothetical protein